MRKSLYCSNSQGCLGIERTEDGRLRLVNTTDPTREIFITPEEFRVFALGVKGDQFDDLFV